MTGHSIDEGNKIPELLAPAGDLDTLKTAVDNGADAVYLGAGSFNARQNAVNFTTDQLAEAIDYAHLHGVLVYLTINTLIADDEGTAALELAAVAWSQGIDAVILQDVGLAKVLKRTLPDLPLFASTQMTIADDAGLRAAARSGISRVILPRELDLPAIVSLTELAQSLGVETEVFVHGALCVSYSGQCLLSSLIGGRSGNRGACAQPCRLPWKLSHQTGNKLISAASPCLSPKDQALIDWLPHLAAAGVRSLKIEGRMRSRAYVGQVVAAYRSALDQVAATGNLTAGQYKRQLLQAFNRGGDFTDRAISGRRSNDFLTGTPVGSFGLLLGTITSLEPQRGILRLMPDINWPADQLPGRGDVLSVRRNGADQEEASAPIGEINRQGRLLVIKGFHPDVLARLSDGDPVYRMTDHLAEQQIYQAKPRQMAIDLILSAPKDSDPASPPAVVLTATLLDVPQLAATLSVQASRPTEPVTPLLPDRLEQQLRKTGQTPFRVMNIRLDGEIRLTIAGINDLRRQVLDQLSDRLTGSRKRLLTGIMPYRWPDSSDNARTIELARIRTRLAIPKRCGQVAAYYHQLPDRPNQIACGADRYYLPGMDLNGHNAPALLSVLRQAEPDSQILIWLPTAMTGQAAELQKELRSNLLAWGFDGLCCGHPGLDLLVDTQSHPLPENFLLVADTGANTYNQETMLYYASLGAAVLCPSLELSSRRIQPLLQTAEAAGIQLELPLYGRMRLMSSTFCPVGQNLPGCRRCHQPALENANPDPGQVYGLLDRKNLTFPLLTHPRVCSSEIFSHYLLSVPQDVADLMNSGEGQGAHFSWNDHLGVRLSFLEESSAERSALIRQARQLLAAGDAAARSAASEPFAALARQIAARLGCQTGRGYYPFP